MAQPVYSQRFYAAGSLSSADGVVGPVCPAGVVWVLRDVDAINNDAGGSDELVVWNQVGGILTVMGGGSTIATQPSAWRGRQVYAEGERIAFQAFVGTWSVAASGYQLTLP